MASKGRPELLRRLEGGSSREDVVLSSFALHRVDWRLFDSESAGPAFETAIRRALATCAGVSVENVAVAFAPIAGKVVEEEPLPPQPPQEYGYDVAAGGAVQEGYYGDQAIGDHTQQAGHEAWQGEGYYDQQQGYDPAWAGHYDQSGAGDYAQQGYDQQAGYYDQQGHDDQYAGGQGQWGHDGATYDQGAGYYDQQGGAYDHQQGHGDYEYAQPQQQQQFQQVQEHMAHPPQWAQGQEGHGEVVQAKRAAASRATGSVECECVITPPVGTPASSIVAALKKKVPQDSLEPFAKVVLDALASEVAVEGLCPDGTEVTNWVVPAVVGATWPDAKASLRGVPPKVFAFLDGVQGLDDARAIITQDGKPHPMGCSQSPSSEELAWAFAKIAEVLKDSKLEKLFVLIIGGLLKRSRRSCIQWASKIAGPVLRNILFDNPVKEQITGKTSSASQQNAMLLGYMAQTNTCVAIAAIAGDILTQWAELAVDEKAFLTDACSGFSEWPDLTVSHARSLWDRYGCRYIVLDGMARSKDGAEGALRHLRKFPADLVTLPFDAKWRGPKKQASFLYLYEAFDRSPRKYARDEFVELMVEIFANAEGRLGPLMSALIEDWDFKSSVKKDFLIAFVSECRYLETKPPAPPERKRCFIIFASAPEEPVKPKVPNTAGIECVILDSVQSAFRARIAKDPGLRGDYTDLSDLFEAALMLCTAETLFKWCEAKRKADPQAMDELSKFLRIAGVRHVIDLLKPISDAEKVVAYDPKAATELLEKGVLWKHDSRERGAFSRLAAKARAPVDHTQLLLAYAVADLAIEGGTMWAFVEALGQRGSCSATCFDRFAPATEKEGNVLRMAMAREIRRCMGNSALLQSKLPVLIGYYAFFCPAFQGILKSQVAIKAVETSVGNGGQAGGKNMVFLVLRVMLLVVSMHRGRTHENPQAVLTEMCKHLEAGGGVSWQLFSVIMETVISKEPPAFSLTILGDCAKELGKSGQLLARKLEKNANAANALMQGTLRAIGAALAKAAPEGWATGLRSLDTVIFTLEFMGKEDFVLAQARFKWEVRHASHQRRVLWELLAAASAIYKAPLIAADAVNSMDADMDVKQVIKKSAPQLKTAVFWKGVSFDNTDWGYILEIAACAAECMKQRFNVVMIPHHVQVITVLMFAIRACGVVGSTPARQAQLPKTLLARVGTGEGKSLIIAMLAAFVAKKGLRAHVINDQRVLTRRDFDTNLPLFQALGLEASPDPARLGDQTCSIVYCSGDDVEQACLDAVTSGTSQKYEEDLTHAILIVDEVDGMIFDKGPASLKEFSDREFSEWVNNWLEQLETTGDIKRDYDDFRSYGESQATIQREVREAYDASFKKKEGVHYAERGQGLYLLDEKTNMIKEGATALWLEAMKRSKLGHHAQYKYIKAVLCRLQCFRTYSCIFGLTGSLGQDAEKQYLMQYYDAVTWNVPYFLDTCRGDEDKSPFVKGEMVKIVSEEGDSAGLRQRKGTKNSLGRLLDVGRDSLLVDLGDGKEVKYMPTCIEKCVSSKKAPKNIGGDKPLEGLDAQEQAVVSLAAAKCNDVPVLVLVKNAEAVHRVAQYVRQDLGAAWGDGTGGVIELLHNPRNPREFVDLVDLSTEPLQVAQDKHAFRVTVTTAEGGRGHDYRVVDPGIDDRGGLLLILTWVPWSEREWIQFLGRTGRQDHAGQFAVFLNSQDDQVKSVIADRKSGETFPQTILRKGDERTAEMLKGVGIDIAKAKLMHKLTTHYWTAHMEELTDKNQDWLWKKLCETYSGETLEGIHTKFLEILNDVEIDEEDLTVPKFDAKKEGPAAAPAKEAGGRYAPTKACPLKSMAELTCQRCGLVNFANWAPDQALPKVSCQQCGASTIVSSFVPVYASTL